MRIPNTKYAIINFGYQGIGLGLTYGLLASYFLFSIRNLPAFVGMTLGMTIYTHGLLLQKSSRVRELENKVFD